MKDAKLGVEKEQRREDITHVYSEGWFQSMIRVALQCSIFVLNFVAADTESAEKQVQLILQYFIVEHENSDFKFHLTIDDYSQPCW